MENLMIQVVLMKINKKYDSRAFMLLVYADDVNLLGDNIGTIYKNTETFIDANKVGLEVNAEKTEYMLLSRHQNTRKNHGIKIANRCLENVAQFNCLGVTVTH
jgi:hypothetical protein